MAYAVVAYPSISDEEKAGTILLRTKRHVADIIVCVGEGDSEIASIARMAGARVLETNGPESTMKSLLETVHTTNPDILVLGCDGSCSPSAIPRLLGPIDSGSADIVEAPWTGFRAFSREALELLRVTGSLEYTPSAKGLQVVRLTQPPVASSLSSERGAALSILTILGILLLAMGILLAAIVAVRLADGVFYLDHALLSIGVIIVGSIVALAGRKLTALGEVSNARS